MTDPTNADLLASDPVVDAVTAALAEEAVAKEALEKAEADLAAANALPPPSASPPPVDNNHVEEGAEQFAAPVPLRTESTSAPVERWRACNGGDISAVLRARSMGLAEFTTRDEVFAFLASKGG